MSDPATWSLSLNDTDEQYGDRVGTLQRRPAMLWSVGLANKPGTEAGFMGRPSTCNPAAKN